MGVVVSRDLPASPERVWSVLVSWERQAEWMPMTQVRVVSGEGIGTRLVAVTGIGPLRVVDPMTVTEWEPGRRCTVWHEGRVLNGPAAFIVEDRARNGCRLTWREDVRLPRLVSVLIKPFFALALRRFSRLVA